MLTIPKHIIDSAPWSMSKLKCAEACSWQYNHKYGPKRIKEVVSFEANRVGVAVHRALELCLQKHAIKLALTVAIDEGKLTENEQVTLNTFKGQILRYVDYINKFKSKHRAKDADELFEAKMGITVEGLGTKFFDKKVFFRGVIDHGILTARRDLVVFDHKSGAERDIAKYESQLKCYSLLANANIPKLNGTQTAINFILTDKLAWSSFTPATEIQSTYFDWLISYMTKATESLTKEPETISNKDDAWMCNYCGYRPICPGIFGACKLPEAQRRL